MRAHDKPVPAAISDAIARAAMSMREFDLQVRTLGAMPEAPINPPMPTDDARPTPPGMQQFLESLRERNKTVSDWAMEQKLPLQAVYRVIKGRSIGRWGSARKVLRAMGIEPPAMPATQGKEEA